MDAAAGGLSAGEVTSPRNTSTITKGTKAHEGKTWFLFRYEFDSPVGFGAI